MLREIRCNLCGANHYRVLFHSTAHASGGLTDFIYTITDDRVMLSPRIVRCLRCGLIYASPRVKLNDLYAKYREMKDETYLSEEKGRRRAAQIMLKRIMKFKRGGRLLDLGCAAGLLLDEAAKAGWETAGVELSHWAAGIAREKFKVQVFEGLLKEAKYPAKYFDVVVMADVIEHLPDPRATLKRIRAILKPDGLLFVSTPDIDSLASRLLKARWWGVTLAHIFYFSRSSLTAMLDAAGFEVVRCRSHTRIFSLRYLGARLSRYSARLGSLLLGSAKLFFAPETLFKVNLGDQIEVYARKKHALAYLAEDEKPSRLKPARLKTIIVLPAYNAAETLAKTVADIPRAAADDILLVDDASRDKTAEIARGLGLKVFRHAKNRGYGANQKTCYTQALEMGAEIVVMVHPDYQYDPKVIPELIRPIQAGAVDAVFGSRMMAGGALEGGMPLWKHNGNILLTALANVVLGTYLTEYHSGFRAYSARYLSSVNFMRNSDGFLFDTEMIVQGRLHNLRIREIPIRTRYFNEASTIKAWPAMFYGLGILKTLLKYLLQTKGIVRFKQFA